MSKKYLTYSQAGVGSTANKQGKTNLIRKAIESVRPENNKYVLLGVGGFAACYDLGAYLGDKIQEKRLRELTRELIKKYKLNRNNYEKRIPYVLAAELLGRKLNLEKLAG